MDEAVVFLAQVLQYCFTVSCDAAFCVHSGILGRHCSEPRFKTFLAVTVEATSEALCGLALD